MSEEMKRLWKILNERYGIYTMEQLREEMAKTELDIGIFTMPFTTNNSTAKVLNIDEEENQS
ncbi:hypothetical protein FDF50_08415 [Clostridium botulinum]|uniref:Uncharacterized protein n=1 Tax=Clostridium botulinum TaxID=1491 RepID=A0A6G4HQ44_CLOBO|nr:hypothetical protein [Clostridium botulinum]MBO0571830.1 hypothetical protein [Clostridium botulinum]NFJ61641.1 hypothetical protein [Clostridium botulinum]NFQ62507.1 hypothetical protein [Clostridium botulinum]NFR17729.1 hypothetical protein [Clostridium botulinum]NFU16749.1 hypothetical protein [Clostridium botulinum]